MANPRILKGNPKLTGTPSMISRSIEDLYFEGLSQHMGDVLDLDQWAEGVQKLKEASDCFIRSTLQ